MRTLGIIKREAREYSAHAIGSTHRRGDPNLPGGDLGVAAPAGHQPTLEPVQAEGLAVVGLERVQRHRAPRVPHLDQALVVARRKVERRIWAPSHSGHHGLVRFIRANGGEGDLPGRPGAPVGLPRVPRGDQSVRRPEREAQAPTVAAPSRSIEAEQRAVPDQVGNQLAL